MSFRNKSLNSKDHATKMKHNSSGSSDYSTCSENCAEKVILDKEQSAILAGQYLQAKNQTFQNDTTIDTINYSVNFLDQNLDILSEEDDVFTDCKDLSESDLIADESTKYVQLESVSNLIQSKSNNYFSKNLKSNNLQQKVTSSKPLELLQVPNNENIKLLTILEESEVTRKSNSLVRIPSLSALSKTRDLVSDMVDQYKYYDKLGHSNKSSSSVKKVVFANDNSVLNNDNQHSSITNKTQVDNKCAFNKRDENSNNQNTTESFLFWEKYYQPSCSSIRKHLSLSDLSTITDSYGDGDEYSTSFKTLDDSYLNYSLDLTVGDASREKKFRRRSKSCESFLKEAKHLPHMLYDKFLKCVADEISYMRQQNVVCTCKEISQKHKKSKERNTRNSKSTNAPVVKVTNLQNDKKESQLRLEIPLAHTVTNHKRLSPETTNRLPQRGQKLCPKSPSTPITPKKLEYYSYKKIVSPVGEYIRGKRPSPFKRSPCKS